MWEDQLLDVLDVGCGDGIQAEWWASRQPPDAEDRYDIKPSVECHGVDLFPPSSDLVNKFYYKQGDYHNLTYKDSQFDIVWSHFSLEYSPTPFKALAEWRRVCKPDGHLYLTIPGSFKKKFGRIHTGIKPGQQSWFTVPMLMYMLAYTGWSPKNSFFEQDFKNGVIRGLIAANPEQSTAIDPVTTNLYEMAEKGVFNEWCNAMINDTGTFDESRLVITWVTGKQLDYRSL